MDRADPRGLMIYRQKVARQKRQGKEALVSETALRATVNRVGLTEEQHQMLLDVLKLLYPKGVLRS